jgi:hypothetical protein|tara:strand:+ start:958 stop:1179 length:222 start_codon:yes stop_codon:yes gene_type:complete
MMKSDKARQKLINALPKRADRADIVHMYAAIADCYNMSFEDIAGTSECTIELIYALRVARGEMSIAGYGETIH